MPFVCGADVVGGKGVTFKHFIQENVQLDDAVAAHRGGENLFIVSALVVSAVIPGEGIGTATVLDGVGVDNSVGDSKRQVYDAVTTSRDGFKDLFSVGAGVVNGDVEAMIIVGNWLALPT